MKIRDCIAVLFTAVLLGIGAMPLSAGEQDKRALDVLKAMSEYKAAQDTIVIRGTTLHDARLDAGLIVSNSHEITVSLKRPASLHFKEFDGINTKELFFHKGHLTVFESGRGYFAQADIPEKIDAALDFALDEMKIDAPLMDLVRSNVFDHLVEVTDSILYLTDRSRVAGIDCHHIVLRGPEVDVQLWIQEGEIPIPRRIMIIDKWEGSAPRFVANMDWKTGAKIDDSEFNFKPPEGAQQIEFITNLDRSQ